MPYSDNVVTCTRAYQGGCSNWEAMSLNPNSHEGSFTIEECHDLCLHKPECVGFYMDDKYVHTSKTCLIVKKGCIRDSDADFEYYAMNQCKPKGFENL